MSQTLERGLAVLELLDSAPTGLGVREISRRMSLPPSNIQRLLATLEGLGYVEKLDPSRIYRLSFRAYFLGQSALRSDRLTSAATPEMERLAIEGRVSVYLAVLRDNRAVYLQVHEGHGLVSTHVAPGESTYLHTTAMGKVLLASMSEERIRGLFDEELPQMTEKSIRTLTGLMENVEKVRQDGLASAIEENLYGIASFAAPVLNHHADTVAALVVALPTSSNMEGEIERVVPLLKQSAFRISEACGFNSV